MADKFLQTGVCSGEYGGEGRRAQWLKMERLARSIAANGEGAGDNILVREGVGQVGKWPNGVITGPLNLTAMHQKPPNIPPEGGSQAYC